jgi:hypothetical protein
VGGVKEADNDGMGRATATTSASTSASMTKAYGREGGGGGISCSIHSKYIPKWSNMLYAMHFYHYFSTIVL